MKTKGQSVFCIDLHVLHYNFSVCYISWIVIIVFRIRNMVFKNLHRQIRFIKVHLYKIDQYSLFAKTLDLLFMLHESFFHGFILLRVHCDVVTISFENEWIVRKLMIWPYMYVSVCHISDIRLMKNEMKYCHSFTVSYYLRLENDTKCRNYLLSIPCILKHLRFPFEK